jgi:hypothetical protein
MVSLTAGTGIQAIGLCGVTCCHLYSTQFELRGPKGMPE